VVDSDSDSDSGPEEGPLTPGNETDGPSPPSGERADQTDCSAVLLEETPEAAVVSNLGTASYHLAAAADRPRNFYMTGAMGCTTPVGLGVALAVDGPVTVLEGDGSLLMSLGCLSTVAAVGPPNLTVVVMNNAAYGTTGGQPSNAVEVDLAAVARDCGLASATVDTVEGLRAAYRAAGGEDGPVVIDCRVEAGDPADHPPIDYGHAYAKHRFREALTGED
jgi:thiamine pyrophosphate-dependent acetolactate synthase large subunit-like protein